MSTNDLPLGGHRPWMPIDEDKIAQKYDMVRGRLKLIKQSERPSKIHPDDDPFEFRQKFFFGFLTALAQPPLKNDKIYRENDNRTVIERIQARQIELKLNWDIHKKIRQRDSTLVRKNEDGKDGPPNAIDKNNNDILWYYIEKWFGLGQRGEEAVGQRCTTDLSCLTRHLKVSARDLNFWDEPHLELLQLLFMARAGVNSANTAAQSLSGIKTYWVSWLPSTTATKRYTPKKEVVEYVALLEKWMKLEAVSKRGLQAKQRRRVAYNNAHPTPISMTKITSLAHKWWNKEESSRDYWRWWLLAINVAIGARFTALLDRRINFAAPPDEWQQKKRAVHKDDPNSPFFNRDFNEWIYQDGVLKDRRSKKRGIPGGDDDAPRDQLELDKKDVVKPILFGFKVDDVVKRINIIRDILDRRKTKLIDMSRKQISNNYIQWQLDRIKDELPGIAKIKKKRGTGFGTHFLRAIYANLSYIQFGEPSPWHMGLASWIRLVLGHNTDDLTTSLSYQSIRIMKAMPVAIQKNTIAQVVENQDTIDDVEKNMVDLKRKVDAIENGMTTAQGGENVKEMIIRIKKAKLSGSEAVDLENTNGDVIKLFYNNRRMKGSRSRQQLIDDAVTAIKQLKHIGIPIRRARLNDLGYSNTIARAALTVQP